MFFHWSVFYWSPQMIKDDRPKPFISKQNKCKRGKQRMELKQNNFRGHTCWWRNFHVNPEICKLVGSTSHFFPTRSPSICENLLPCPNLNMFPFLLGFNTRCFFLFRCICASLTITTLARPCFLLSSHCLFIFPSEFKLLILTFFQVYLCSLIPCGYSELHFFWWYNSKLQEKSSPKLEIRFGSIGLKSFSQPLILILASNKPKNSSIYWWIWLSPHIDW